MITNTETKNQDLMNEKASIQEDINKKEQEIVELQMNLRSTQERLAEAEREVNDLRESALDTTHLEGYYF